jgi:serine/threonine protein kinase
MTWLSFCPAAQKSKLGPSVVALVRCERDSYRLIKKVSTGGMGIVWQAQSAKNKRRVIVKEPLIDEHHDQIKIERLLIEAAVLRTINDELGLQTADQNQQLMRTHVVRYVDQLTDPAHPLLVLEYLDGPSLSQAYAGKPVGEGALQQTLTLLRVIEAIHSNGVIHRDISPNNIILTADRGLVLIDFGTSIILRGAISSKSFQSGRIVFKRGFSAPELLEGRSDARSDVFSVGATMFYLLTGKNPGDFMSQNELTKDASELNPSISRAASEIVRTAMSPNPETRFQTAREMADAIESQGAKHREQIPTITIGGILYELRSDFVDIGREHSCGPDCKSLGYNKPVQVRIADPQKYIEKHHARIWVASSGKCFIEDLRTTNRTAIKRGREGFRIISSSVRESLQDRDIVALAYNPARGPYVSFTFNSR